MLSQKINDYIDWKSSCTDKSAYIYGGHLREFLALVGDKPMGELSVEDLTTYRHSQLKNHKESYVNYKMGAVRNFLRYCREKNIDCPSTFFVPFQRTISVPHYAITEKEYRKMLDTVSGHNFEDVKMTVVLRLLWECGIRVSELCDINLQDIDSPGRMISIMSKKTKQPYWVCYSQKTKEAMDYYLGVRLCMNCLPELIVASRTYARPTTRTVERWIKKMMLEAGIRNKVVPHSFRHGKAHFVLDNGGTVIDVNHLLGHSHKNLNSALSYVRLNKSEATKTARKFVKG